MGARRTYDLETFPLKDMTACGAALRSLGAGAATMEEAAERIVSHLYEGLSDPGRGDRACALVRFYKTHAYGALPPNLREVARSLLPAGTQDSPDMKCLTLLATIGDQPEWRSRTTSAGHKVIPLPSESVVSQFPMVAQLVRQFGVELGSLFNPRPELLLDTKPRYFHVFHVPNAVGSPFIPAQTEFVIRFGIKSVLGFGGMLPMGDLFAVILFSKVAVDREVATAFKTIALSARVAVLGFGVESTFR